MTISPPNDARAMRETLLAALLPLASVRGWGQDVIAEAASAAGLSHGDVLLCAPNGAMDLIDTLADLADDDMLVAMQEASARITRVRERVAAGVRARILALANHKEAVRRAASVMALPGNTMASAQITWRSADRIWRALGDRSVDFNWYSKRTILSGVIASTMLRWFADASEDHSATFDFLDRRIDNVMQFEKLKASAPNLDALMDTLVGVAARMRFGLER